MNYRLFRAHFNVSDLSVRSEILELMRDASSMSQNFLPNIAAASQAELDELDNEIISTLSVIVARRASPEAKYWFRSQGV